ncbi:SDR family NAD(P)-dependent oxidoreductase [Motilimonas pumila]|uniref:SDR family NAD(P)-dependent oxidoreductase n=1 Tax=Motilimonas pumila TaxID=2303987 RepID=A0A418YJM9_9GAMM|nr:SDR family NAD(P)-dependent oxidoreductase [Motilimonas pumila]RJG51176.1 SDR family NAD(P)-dependent oxidoreductase [Motilimonas pumila]
MSKTILITGATDGIGLAAAEMLLELGHKVMLHGRNEAKLAQVKQKLAAKSQHEIVTYVADLSDLVAVKQWANSLAQELTELDCLINNAGVFNTPQSRTEAGLDIRFAVNTLAPYILTNALMSLLGSSGRVVNLSSAAQAEVSISALQGKQALNDGLAYAQSKLAITMWNYELSLQPGSPVMIAVNPASMLGSKMVKQAYGVAGGDISIGATILARAATEDEFASATGRYFDNDIGRFAEPHSDVANKQKRAAVMQAIEELVA